MKTLRKSIALAITILCCCTIMPNAFAVGNFFGIEGVISSGVKENVFQDAEEVCSDAAVLLEELKIINGFDDGKIREDLAVTRAEMVKMIISAIGAQNNISINTSVEARFLDTKTHWARTYIEQACNMGIVKGTGVNTFSPDWKVTSRQACTMVYRAILGDKSTESIDVWFNTDKLSEAFSGSFKVLDNTKAMTRGESFDVLCYAIGQNEELINTLSERTGVKVEKIKEVVNNIAIQNVPINKVELNGNNVLKIYFNEEQLFEALKVGNGTDYYTVTRDNEEAEYVSEISVKLTKPESKLYIEGKCKDNKPFETQVNVMTVSGQSIAEVYVTSDISNLEDNDNCWKLNDKAVKVTKIGNRYCLAIANMPTDFMKPQDTPIVKYKVDANWTNNTYDILAEGAEIFDSVPPSILSAEMVGTKEFVINFSEYVKFDSIAKTIVLNSAELKENIIGNLLSSGESYVKTARYSTGSYLFDVENNHEITYYLSLVNYVDTSNLIQENIMRLPLFCRLPEKTINVTVKEVTPRCAILQLSTATIVNLNNSEFVKNFVYAGNALASNIYLSEDGKELKVFLDNWILPKGYTFNLVINNANRMFVDTWGNTVFAEELVLPISVTDVIAPTVTEVDLNENQTQLKITFNESVGVVPSVAIMRKGTNVTEDILGTNVAQSMDGKIWTIATNAEKFENDKYTVIISNAEDAVNNKMEEHSAVIETRIMRPVELEKAIYVQDKDSKVEMLYIYFSNDMKEAVINKDNWSLPYNATVKSVEFNRKLKNVVIVKLDKKMSVSDIEDNGLDIVLAATVIDVNDNHFANNGIFSTLIENVTLEAFKENLEANIKLYAIEKGLLRLVIDKAVDIDASSLQIENIILTADTLQAKAVYLDYSTILDDGSVCYVLKVSNFNSVGGSEASIMDGAAYVNGNPIRASINEIKLLSGAEIGTIQCDVIDHIPSRITQKPSIDQVGANVEVLFSFSEHMTSSNAAMIATELNVTYEGKKLIAGIDYVTVLNEDKLKVILINRTYNEDTVVKIRLDRVSLYLSDDNNNAVQPFEY